MTRRARPHEKAARTAKWAVTMTKVRISQYTNANRLRRWQMVEFKGRRGGYANLTKSYFDDAWDTNPGDPGFSCCQNSTLRNPVSQLSSRIDLVLTHAASRALDADLIGDAPFEAMPPLWPSDHAGVIATLRIH
jgi:hypothetical protein